MAITFTLSNVWYGTQLGTLFFTFLTLTSSLKASYVLAYIFIVTSLAISLYQALTAEQKKKNTEPNSASSTSSTSSSTSIKAAADPKQQAIDFVNSLKPLIKPAQSHPTTPYILLSLAHLFILPRYIITLIPFAIFAFFHALNFTRTFIVSLLPINADLQTKVKSILGTINEKYNNNAFKLAVWVQIYTLASVILWTTLNLPLNLIGYGDGHTLLNILTVAVWSSFINVIQSQNLLMKSAFNEIVATIDGLAVDPRAPPQVKEVWARVKHAIKYKDLNHSE